MFKMQKNFTGKCDEILATLNNVNLSPLLTDETYLSKPKLNNHVRPCSSDESLNEQPNIHVRSVFPNEIPDTKEVDRDSESSYQTSDSTSEDSDGSPEMEKAVECLKRSFFTKNSAQNTSSNAKNCLFMSSNEDNSTTGALVDNFSERMKRTDQLTLFKSNESVNSDCNETESINSCFDHASLEDFDARSEETTLTSESDLSQYKLQESASTLGNNMSVVLRCPENHENIKYTKLKRHLLKERVLTCQLITQKTISDLRAKLAEQIVESEQAWKNKLCVDMNTTKTYLEKITSMFVRATNEAKNEVKKNDKLMENLTVEKKKKKYWKSKQKKIKTDLETKTRQIEEKDKKIEQLQETMRLNEDTMKDMKNKTDGLIRQLQLEEQTNISDNRKNEERLKREHQKLEKSKEELQSEKNLHRFTKNAYEALKEDWNVLFQNSLKLHLALVHSMDELNRVSSTNYKYSFTKC